LAVPEGELSEETVITGFAFHRAPTGESSAMLEDVTVRMGTAGGAELGRDFDRNAQTLETVLEAEHLNLEADDEGMVVFTLDTPWDYQGGDLLLDIRFGGVSGYLYIWGWSAPGRRYVSSNDPGARQGTVSEVMPAVTLITR
jgi:hypothetical protein